MKLVELLPSVIPLLVFLVAWLLRTESKDEKTDSSWIPRIWHRIQAGIIPIIPAMVWILVTLANINHPPIQATGSIFLSMAPTANSSTSSPQSVTPPPNIEVSTATPTATPSPTSTNTPTSTLTATTTPTQTYTQTPKVILIDPTRTPTPTPTPRCENDEPGSPFFISRPAPNSRFVVSQSGMPGDIPVVVRLRRPQIQDSHFVSFFVFYKKGAPSDNIETWSPLGSRWSIGQIQGNDIYARFQPTERGDYSLSALFKAENDQDSRDYLAKCAVTIHVD